MSLISSLPPFMVGGVGGQLVMLVSLGGRLFELMLIGLSRFRYRRVRMVITIGFVGHGARVPFKLLLPDSDFMLITSFGDSIVMTMMNLNGFDKRCDCSRLGEVNHLVCSLGECDDDFVLVRLLLTMVSEYDPYLGGAAPRAWCLQPWRVGSSFFRVSTRKSEPLYGGVSLMQSFGGTYSLIRIHENSIPDNELQVFRHVYEVYTLKKEFKIRYEESEFQHRTYGVTHKQYHKG
ncbi:hypothetical protein Tco_0485113 [Tanacetum coccineum]